MTCAASERSEIVMFNKWCLSLNAHLPEIFHMTEEGSNFSYRLGKTAMMIN